MTLLAITPEKDTHAQNRERVPLKISSLRSPGGCHVRTSGFNFPRNLITRGRHLFKLKVSVKYLHLLIIIVFLN